MKIFLIFLFIYFSFLGITLGQEPHVTIKEDGGEVLDHCPGDAVTYFIDCTDSWVTQITNLKWEVKGGVIIEDGENNDNSCKIEWNDTIAGEIKIASICVDYDYMFNGQNKYTLCKDDVILEVDIKSINDVTPIFSTPVTSVAFEANSSIQYSVSPVQYGNGTNASKYKWYIPTNWILGGVTSTGINVYTTSTNTITVIPDDCSSGEIKVWAVNTKCLLASNSDTTILTISRKYPDFEITGSEKLCTTGSYSINTTSDYSVSWIPCSGMTIDSGQGTNQITVSKLGDNDNCLLKASVTYNLCSTSNSATFKKSVNIGVPDENKIDISLEGDNLLACDYTSGTAGFDGTAGIDAYEWYMPNASDWEIEEESGAGPDNKYVEIDYQDDPPPIQEVIYVRAHNSCGWSYWAHQYFSVIDNCSGYWYYLAISPNPADPYVEFSLIEDKARALIEDSKESKIRLNEKDIEEGDILVEIIDKNAVIRKSVKLKKMKTNINTKDLEPDTYFVHVTVEDEIYRQQLIIK